MSNIFWGFLQANKAQLSATVASQVDAAKSGLELLDTAQRTLMRMQACYKVLRCTVKCFSMLFASTLVVLPCSAGFSAPNPACSTVEECTPNCQYCETQAHGAGCTGDTQQKSHPLISTCLQHYQTSIYCLTTAPWIGMHVVKAVQGVLLS